MQCLCLWACRTLVMDLTIFCTSLTASSTSSVILVRVSVAVCDMSIIRLQERNSAFGMTSSLRAEEVVSRKWPWRICSSVSGYGLLISFSKETHFLHSRCCWVYTWFFFINLSNPLHSTQCPLYNGTCYFTLTFSEKQKLKWISIRE